MTGLLSEHPNKNCETIAEIIPNTNEQSLQGLLTDMVWDEEDLNRQRVVKMKTETGEGDGVLIIDDTGFAKQGTHSVGVARQYSGTLGKVGNCQVAVNCHYAERTLGWPVTTRLYLPKAWAEDLERRKGVGVPEEVTFQTKPEIALDLVDTANRYGVVHAAVVADADYGDNPLFLNGLEARGEHYVVEVRCDFTVSLSRGAGAARLTIAGALAQLPLRRWHTIRWHEGSQGWLRAKFAAIRCWRVDGDGTRHLGWLIGQKPARGQTGDPKYMWSDFPAATPLSRMVELVHRRHWVEQYHEEAKEVLGWDQYQGRLWSGFHRNSMLVMVSYSFLVWVEWRERTQRVVRGRPRGAFSPSGRSPAAVHRQRSSQAGRPHAGPGSSGVTRRHHHRPVPSDAELTK
jgi:SRSO17 transposase